MAPPQLITDFMRLMLLLAPSAAVICLVLSGLSLRQGSVPDALIGGDFAKWMFWAIVFLTLPQLIRLSAIGIHVNQWLRASRQRPNGSRIVLLGHKRTFCCRIVLWEHASPRQAHRKDASRHI